MSTLLDTPISKPKIKFFPTEPGKRFKSKVMKLIKPLVPTKYKPVPKSHTKQKKNRKNRYQCLYRGL